MQTNEIGLKGGVIEQYGLKEIKVKDEVETLELLTNSSSRTRILEKYDITNNTDSRNRFAQLLRDCQSILCPKFTVEDKIYVKEWSIDYARFPEYRPQLLFQLEDILYQIRHNSKDREYEGYEEWGHGILSDFIQGELKLGRGFTLLIKGRPRSGKSLSGVTISHNTSGSKFTIGTPNESGDIVYTDFDYYKVRDRRRLDKSLNGSSQMIDEGIEVMDSMKGIWDESIQGMIKTVKTQQFENSLLVVITPDESDIAKKLRDSFSAVLEPWYDEGNRVSGEVKREINWSSETGYSTWKFHLNKKDRKYGERLDFAGIGKISKINIHIPPKEIVKQYLTLSAPRKIRIQERESEKSQKRLYKQEPAKFVDEKVDDIIKKGIECVQNERGKITIDSVHTEYPQLSYTAARKIASRLKRRLKMEGHDAAA